MEDSLEARSQLVAEKCVSLGKGVRRIVAGNAGLMTGPGTNTYLFGMREVAVLDPGPDDARHLEAILEAAGSAIRWIIVTHTHPDHSPLAGRLARSVATATATAHAGEPSDAEPAARLRRSFQLRRGNFATSSAALR